MIARPPGRKGCIPNGLSEIIPIGPPVGSSGRPASTLSRARWIEPIFEVSPPSSLLVGGLCATPAIPFIGSFGPIKIRRRLAHNRGVSSAGFLRSAQNFQFRKRQCHCCLIAVALSREGVFIRYEVNVERRRAHESNLRVMPIRPKSFAVPFKYLGAWPPQ